MMNVGVQMFMLITFVGFLVFSLSLFFIENESNEMSELAFECGFEPVFMARVPFSVHFFTVTVVFLIFDLEVVILVPILFKLVNFLSLLLASVVVWLLLVGLFVEWFDSSVSWQF